MPDPRPAWRELALEQSRRLQSASLHRRRRVIAPLDATHVRLGDRQLVHFCSNDYLGLSHHPRICQAVKESTDESGAGSGAAPLISGYTPIHAAAEQTLAHWKGADAAVLFPSGYQANLAAIQTAAALGSLTGGVRFLVDKLAHASLVDAIRATREPFRVFPHNHLPKLKRLLDQAEPGALQVVVTESIFSMDGDAADLPGLCALRREHNFLLIVDEAHATGVYGPGGAGLARQLHLHEQIDVTIATMSKAMGAIGGCVCAAEPFIDMLVNHARAYLFSTSVPASVAAAALAAVDVMAAEPQRQLRLASLSRRVRAALARQGRQIPMGDSPIIPLILGAEQTALSAADALLEARLLVLPVRPPTVPRGSSRLRVTLSSEHTDDEVDQLIAAIAKLPPADSPAI